MCIRDSLCGPERSLVLLRPQDGGVAHPDERRTGHGVEVQDLVPHRGEPPRGRDTGGLRHGLDGERVPTVGDAQAVEVLECALDGDAIDIAFNPAYLLDGLAAVGASATRFSFTQATRPAVLTGIDDKAASIEDYKYLLMPVRRTG